MASIICTSIQILKRWNMGKYLCPLSQQYSMEFRDLIYIVIALLLAVVLFYVFIWLVPIIIVLIIAYVIYIFLKGPDNY